MASKARRSPRFRALARACGCALVSAIVVILGMTRLAIDWRGQNVQSAPALAITPMAEEPIAKPSP